jgi:hypothetical protein
VTILILTKMWQVGRGFVHMSRDFGTRGRGCVCLLCCFFFSCAAVGSDHLDAIGVTVLRQFDPSLTGGGITVAHPEARYMDLTPPDFEPNPDALEQPADLFSYWSSLGTATNFPNFVGSESDHANAVGAHIYGRSRGVAPGVAHVDSYDAWYFFTNFVWSRNTIAARIVNQSFIFSTNSQTITNAAYDSYAAEFNTLFVNGAGNRDISPAASSYNAIAVGVTDGPSSAGPTYDGRCKPDIMAPGYGGTSFSAPYVTGAAVVLLQAATRGDGRDPSATNAIVIKTLLLNGAVKPPDWTNSTSSPLDLRHGAGVLNIFNSYHQLTAGRCVPTETTSVNAEAAHPSGDSAANVRSLPGWDYNSISSSRAPPRDATNHYYFNVPAGPFPLIATLNWNRQLNQSNINDLNLYLYDIASGSLVAQSASEVDNTEHLFVPQLPAGRYDLQVWKKGGCAAVSDSETYALAFDFVAPSLRIVRAGGNAFISWPNVLTNFVLESTGSLCSPRWSAVTNRATTAGNQKFVAIPHTAGAEFFRLWCP